MDKAWGKSELIYANHLVEIQKISVLPGGYSSLHHHKNKSNIFTIISGSLDVYVTSPNTKYELSEDTLKCCEIEPGANHRFYSKEGAEAYEIYLIKQSQSSILLDLNDIVRLTVGGMDNQAK